MNMPVFDIMADDKSELAIEAPFIFMDAGAGGIQRLREEYSALAVEARGLTDPDKEYTDEASSRVDEIYTRLDRIDSQITAHAKAVTINDDLNTRATTIHQETGGNISVDEHAKKLAIEDEIFNTWLRKGEKALNQEQRDYVAERQRNAPQNLGVGVPGEGGVLAPSDFSRRLLEMEQAFGGVQEVADVINTSDGRTLDWATTDETSEEGELVAENQSATDGDPNFGTTQIGAFKFSSKVITISFELLQDNLISLETRILGWLATRLARGKNRYYTIGTGIAEPQGVLVGAAAGITGGSINAISYDELVDMEHSVDPAYRVSGCGWMFHDSTLKILKKLKDADGRPIWRPGLTGGDPADILGYPYTINQQMPTMTTGAISLIFGNFKKYLVRNVMAATMFRFADSVYTKKGQIGFLAWSRSDGKLIDVTGEAIRKFQNA